MKKCLLCGQSKYSAKIAYNNKFGWPVLYCKKCELGYTGEDDAKIKKAYKQYYSGEYWHSRKARKNITGTGLRQSVFRHGVKALRFMGVHPLIAISHHEMLKEWIRAQDKGSATRFLEIGPGEGHSLRYFSNFYDVSAIEPDKKNCQKINKRLGKKACKAGDIETDPIKGKFDVIYLSHVFEHLVYPLRFLNTVKNNLAKGGIIFIEVPNCANPSMKKSSTMENETHTFHYTSESLRNIFTKAGLRIVDLGVYSPLTYNPAKATWRSIRRIPSYRKANDKEGMNIVMIAKR
ncbi:class I SAM-dependent methyltransferase [Candidatus Woesearchaeota archaeon]|nr:class I SAM-dependent methyltransferase [Candidatus Woesearchaeota archaeon]